MERDPPSITAEIISNTSKLEMHGKMERGCHVVSLDNAQLDTNLMNYFIFDFPFNV